jgi:hypothetical protein
MLVRGLQWNETMNRFGRRLGRAALALGLALVAAACSAPTVPDTSSSDEELGAESSDPIPTKTPRPTTPAAKPSTPPPVVTPAGTAPPPPAAVPNACAQQVGEYACFDCCNQASGGALGVADNVFDQCACGSGGACTAVCDANYCTNGQTTAACEACLTATCEPLENTQCTSAACKAGMQCLDQCP